MLTIIAQQRITTSTELRKRPLQRLLVRETRDIVIMMQIDVFTGTLQINRPFTFDDRCDVNRTFHQCRSGILQRIEIMYQTKVIITRFDDDPVMSVVEIRFVETDVVARLELIQVENLLSTCFLIWFLVTSECFDNL